MNVCTVPPLAQHELRAALEKQRARIRRSIVSLDTAVRSLGESQSEEGTAGDRVTWPAISSCRQPTWPWSTPSASVSALWKRRWGGSTRAPTAPAAAADNRSTSNGCTPSPGPSTV